MLWCWQTHVYSLSFSLPLSFSLSLSLPLSPSLSPLSPSFPSLSLSLPLLSPSLSLPLSHLSLSLFPSHSLPSFSFSPSLFPLPLFYSPSHPPLSLTAKLSQCPPPQKKGPAKQAQATHDGKYWQDELGFKVDSVQFVLSSRLFHFLTDSIPATEPVSDCTGGGNSRLVLQRRLLHQRRVLDGSTSRYITCTATLSYHRM